VALETVGSSPIIHPRFEEKADHGKVVGFLYFFLFRNMQQHERKAVVRALASEQATRG
jgi:hypothetical protein